MSSLGGPVYLPSVMFSRSGVTLDDLSPGDISALCGRETVVADSLSELP